MSPYFPPRSEMASAYWCPNCHEWYLPSPTACTVYHPYGSCCHKHETPVTPPERTQHVNAR